jgi:hypothetical protein
MAVADALNTVLRLRLRQRLEVAALLLLPLDRLEERLEVALAEARYDNLKSAVAQVLGLNRARVETDRWIAFRSHFDIESFYCRPGIEGAHEKGGAEGMIGYFRRNHFTPVPEVNSLAELWTKTFTDPRLCAAIVDRLTFNGTIIETGTDSYRLASTRARAEETAKAG